MSINYLAFTKNPIRLYSRAFGNLQRKNIGIVGEGKKGFGVRWLASLHMEVNRL
jgi:hypothetical protein